MTLIRDALMAAGDAFHAGRCDELAAEWADYFADPATAVAWIEAGFWDAGSASCLSDAGASPSDEIRYKSGHAKDHGYGIDPVYAYCNSDCSIDDLEWS